MFETALRDFQSGQFDSAEAQLRSHLSSVPDDVNAVSLLGVLLLQQRGPVPEAEQCMQRALELAPNHPDLTNNLGSLYWKKGDVNAALQCFISVLSIKPEHIDALHNSGNCHAALGNNDEATTFFARANTLAP